MADEFIPGQKVCIHLIHKSDVGKIVSGTANVEGVNPNPGGGGVFDIACRPGSRLPTSCTSETSAVTCELCKATEVFKNLEIEQHPDSNGSQADREALEFIEFKKQKHQEELAKIKAEGGSFVKLADPPTV